MQVGGNTNAVRRAGRRRLLSAGGVLPAAFSWSADGVLPPARLLHQRHQRQVQQPRRPDVPGEDPAAGQRCPVQTRHRRESPWGVTDVQVVVVASLNQAVREEEPAGGLVLWTLTSASCWAERTPPTLPLFLLQLWIDSPAGGALSSPAAAAEKKKEKDFFAELTQVVCLSKPEQMIMQDRGTGCPLTFTCGLLQPVSGWSVAPPPNGAAKTQIDDRE